MTDAEVASLAESLSKKVLAVLVRAGPLNQDGEVYSKCGVGTENGGKAGQ